MDQRFTKMEMMLDWRRKHEQQTNNLEGGPEQKPGWPSNPQSSNPTIHNPQLWDHVLHKHNFDKTT